MPQFVEDFVANGIAYDATGKPFALAYHRGLGSGMWTPAYVRPDGEVIVGFRGEVFQTEVAAGWCALHHSNKA